MVELAATQCNVYRTSQRYGLDCRSEAKKRKTVKKDLSTEFLHSHVACMTFLPMLGFYLQKITKNDKKIQIEK